MEGQLIAIITRLDRIIELLETRKPAATKNPPPDYSQYHHPNCGVIYRGCDPDLCPKDVYERTGVWIGVVEG